MYEYLKDIDEGNQYAVINTEGRICILASETAVREEVMLRHYAFLLDYMRVPVDKILFVSLDCSAIEKIKQRFNTLYKKLPFQMTPVEKIGKTDGYEYVLICDTHNIDIFSAKTIKGLADNARNLYAFARVKSLRTYKNIDVAEFLQSTNFDFEISTDGQYSVADYLQEVKDILEKQRIQKELEEQRAREKALREAQRKAREEAERKAREEQARIEAERKAREEAERKAREEAERKAREEAERIAREKAEAERKRREEEARIKAELEKKRKEEAARKKAEEALRKKQESTPLFKELRPYMDWYIKNWNFMVEHGQHKWDAVWHFQKHFNIRSTNLRQNLNSSFDKCDKLLTDVLYSSEKVLEKCAQTCPRETQLLLRNLFNEGDSFEIRMMLYRSQAERIGQLMQNRSSFSKEDISLLKNVRAAATFLALARPDKHYLFRLFTFQQFCNKVNIKAPAVSEFEQEFENYERICNQVRSALMAYPELIRLHNETYTDISDYHLLTFDFIYAIGQRMKDLKSNPQ